MSIRLRMPRMNSTMERWVLVSRERAAVEHGFANLKSWQTISKLHMNVRQATTLLRAPLVLANTELQR